jgi:PAS domain S-box-containing protein
VVLRIWESGIASWRPTIAPPLPLEDTSSGHRGSDVRDGCAACDTCWVVVAHRALGALAVPPESSSVGAARRFVEQRLREAGLLADVIDTAVLLTSELVTNAVMHTGTEVVVRVGAGVGAMIEVRDGELRSPLRRRHAADDVSGRGLELVELLADDYGVVPIAGVGKSIWFVVGDPSRAVANDGWGPPELAAPIAEVVLGHLPVVLYDVLREHNEALLREYTLQLLERAGEHAADLREVGAVERARLTVASAVAAWRNASGSDDVPSHIDLRLAVSDADVPGFGRLLEVVEAAEHQASQGRLLTLPALPELVALRSWLFGQIVSQLRGGVPIDWVFSDDATSLTSRRPAEFDASWVSSTEQAVVVGDDTNHILAVSSAAAALLGWTPEDLVGRRVTTIIPYRLREAHVAGFTRQLVTSRRRLLGQQIVLPAVHRDGRELLVTVTLTKEACDGRAVFFAWLTH